MKKLLLFCLLSLVTTLVSAQVSLTTINVAKQENFNSSTTTPPSGWYAEKAAGTNAAAIGSSLTLITFSGNPTAGGAYNAGVSGDTDRSLGSLASGSLSPRFGASFVNNTGSIVTSIDISGVMEQWKSGSNALIEKLPFEYSFNATSISDGAATWTSVTSLDLIEKLTTTTTAAAVNGNLPENQTAISGTISSISWSIGATLYIRWTDNDDAGSDGVYTIDDFSITPKGASSNSPNLTTNFATLAFGNHNINTVSAEKPLELTYSNLTTSDLTLSTAAPFSISKTSNGTYGTSLTYSDAERTSPTTLYVKYAPTAAGNTTGSLSISGAGLASTTSVTLNGTGIDPNVTSFNFENCAPANSTTLSDGFTQYSSVGAQTWACTTFGRDASDATGKASLGNAVQINGFSGGNNANTDWLISPALNLSTMTYPLLSFWSRTAFNGDGLQLKYSTNYTGSGDPAAATWVNLDGRFPLPSSDTWTRTQNIDLTSIKNQTVYIAFVYTSTITSGARWTIDDFEITNSSTPAPTELFLPVNSLNFGYQTASTTSTERAFNFSTSSITNDVLVSAPTNFTISKTSGGTFSSNLTYTVAEANNATQTIYTKFAPTAVNTNYSQNLTISTSGVPSQTLSLLGNTFNANSTLEVVNWNIEWFGASGNGPSNKTQQAANVKTIFDNVNADFYALQEVVDTTLFRNSSLPAGYNVIFSDFGSYADDKNDPDYTTAQKLAFMYRTDIIKPVTWYGVLRDTYYPSLTNSGDGSPYKNWSSGRFPFLMEAKATINNVEETIYFIDIHAKANTGANDAEKNDAYDRRKGGALQLKQWIDANLAGKKVIILGDFNDVLNPDKTIAPKPAGTGTSYSDFTLDNVNYVSVTLPLSLAGKRSTAGFPTVIDNVIVNKTLNSIYLDNSAEVLDNVTQMVSSYSSTTTDHYPVQTRYFFQEPVLPVKFEDFTAKQEGASVILRWSTASESNNNYFTVERSTDGVKFEKVKDVASNGNANQKNTYSAIDNNPKQGRNYYRLKQTDLNGDVSYFPEVRVVNILDGNTGLLIYPNPVKDKVTINYVSTSSNIELSLISNDGRLIFKSKGSVKSLEQQLNSKIASIPNGLYIVSFTENGKSHREKLVKH